MPPETLETLLSFFKVLADETRLRIIGLLATREFSVEELAATLGVKEPTVSHHLSKLKELNLVQMRPDGNTHHYWLNSDGLRSLSKDVLTPETIAEAAAKDLDLDKFGQKVLQTFVIDGRIREIPAQRKKRDVVLDWLIKRFEHGRRYAEPEVNELIKQVHADYAFLRRELIMVKLLQRDEGLHGKTAYYWRP